MEFEVIHSEEGSFARISDFGEPSRAKDAGLEVGDIIVSLDDEAIDPEQEVGRILNDLKPDGELMIGIVRNGTNHSVRVQRARVGYLGIRPRGIETDERQRLGIRAQQGVQATQVISGGPAAQGGLLQNDIILEIAGHDVNTGNLSELLQHAGAGALVDFQILRDERHVSLRITLGERPTR